MATSWRLKEEEGIHILELDEPGTDVNVLTTANLTELKGLLRDLSTRTDVKALLIVSAKPRIFVAGADIKEIQGISNEREAYEKAEQGKEVFQLLENLKYPTITVINGACLGGGLELALSTRFRVASIADQVKIGLPEVNLGILPGFGGSIRLPRLVGLVKGLPLILAGKIMSAQDALRNGVIDRLFPDASLRQDAIRFAYEMISIGASSLRSKKKKKPDTWFLEDTKIGRSIVFKTARKDVYKKTKGFYPAPLEIISLIEKTYGADSAQSFQEESKAFQKLGATLISKNLIKLFFLTEKYKKLAWTPAKIPAWNVRKCGVVGAGVMGGGIAQRVSAKDIPVRVKDINEKALSGALKEAKSIYDGALKRRRIKKHELEYKMGLISVGLTLQGFKNCDIVIEAVVEDIGIKKKVFAELSEVVSESAILASNTSSLPVTQMAAVCKKPERVIGLHFFNPVHLMPLVEVIRAEQTSDETVEKTIQFSRQLGKTVIVVKDAPGFLVNRLLLPYLNEAAYLLEEGVSPETIDRIASEFGMPMGPVELVDQVGIDVGYKVGHVLQEAFGARMKVASILEEVKAGGLLGRKSKKGFYLYNDKGHRAGVNPEVKIGKHKKGAVADEDVRKRLVYVMINEAARCLDEKVVDSAATVDIGMIMGTGFPAFRGGLLHYADLMGLDQIVKDLERFHDKVSADRFAVSPYLQALLKDKKKFYS